MGIKLSLSARSTLSIPILALSLFTANSMAAGSNEVARCVDSNGDVTYTDFYCETTENSNPMLMTESAIERRLRRDHRYDIFSNNNNSNPVKDGYGQDSRSAGYSQSSYNLDSRNNNGHNNAVATANNSAISPMRLTAITRNAANRCNQHVTRFFRRKHPGVSNIPAIEFNDVKDRFINGPNVSVTIRAIVDYDDRPSTMRSYIDCTAQKFANNGGSDWKVGYLER